MEKTTITDFRNYVYEYLRWKGKNIGSCEECGILFIQTNNSHKYCKVCAKDNKNKKIVIMNRKRRQSKRNGIESD